MTLAERYLELGLRLGRHVDGLVDAYYGPAELERRVAAEEPADPGRLAAAAAALLGELDEAGLTPGRTRWLRGQLRGLECVARRLAGEPIAYADEVERCYGVRPRWTQEETFERAHRALDEALPGGGPLGARYDAWHDAHTIPGDRLAELVAAVVADTRDRTERLLGLPPGEHVELELVQGVPWTAFNYYLGGLRSRVAVSTDLPLRAAMLLPLVTHECYPGHHTEHVMKEELLVRGAGWLEETILLVATPQALVSEGIAEVAAEVLLGDEEEAVAAEHLAPAGIRYDAGTAAAVRAAFAELRAVGTNAALLVHDRGAALEDVVEYEMRWGLHSRVRAEKALEFITDPTWRAYVACYSEGRRLARAFVGGDVARFGRLLREQIVPDELAAAGPAAAGA